MREREAHDDIDAGLRHQRAHACPAPVALLEAEYRVAPLGRPFFFDDRHALGLAEGPSAILPNRETMKAALYHHSRRGFIALGSAFALTAASAGAQTPAALTPLRVASAADEDILGTVWAMQHGIFAKNGLEVDLRPSNSGAAVAAAVVGGSIDIGKS